MADSSDRGKGGLIAALVRRYWKGVISIRRLISVALGLFAALFLLSLTLYPFIEAQFNDLEAITYDIRMRTRPRGQISPGIMLVGLTDLDKDTQHATLATRELHALLLTTLKNLNVGAVVYDIIFLNQLEQDLFMALEMEQIPCFVPYHLYIRQEYPRLEEFERRKRTIDESWFLPYSYDMEATPGQCLLAEEIKLPSPALMEAAAGLGHINVEADPDGVVRRIPLLIRYQHPRLGDCLYPSISLRYVLHHQGLCMRDLRVRFGEAIEFTAGEPPVTTRIPIDRRGQMLINFREGKSFTHRGLSVSTMLTIGRQLDEWIRLPPARRPPLEGFEVEGRPVPRALFEGKTVLIGDVATASTDIHATTLDPALPMVTVHANVISSILNRDFVHSLPPWGEPALTLLMGLLSGLIFGRVGYLRSFILGTLFAGLFLLGSWLAFAQWSLWIPIALPILTQTLAAILILLYHLVTEEKRQRVIRSAFEAYTSPEVVQEILRNIDDPALWGARRRVTTLFVDIRGFTTLTEQTPPEVVVEILNEYYQVAVQAIQRHGGIPNKFIGDEIMALFNAPRAIPNSEEAACRAAVDIQLDIYRLNAERLRPRMGQQIACGVGVNTGEVIVGIVGRQKIEYTALGDDVNIASRLQGQARPGQVLIGQATHEALRRTASEFLSTAVWQVRHIPEIVLKGLSRRFDVYELCYERRRRART